MKPKIHSIQNTHSKQILWLAMAAILIVFLFLFYAKQRVLYQDSAFFLFRICNLESVIENHRYAAQLNYLLAYVAAYVGLPINLLIYLLSMGSFVFASFTAAVLWLKTKNIYLCALPLLALILPGPEMFFLPVSEMYIAISFAIFMLGSFYFKYKYAFPKYALPSLLGALAFNAHPGILPLIATILAWNWINNSLKDSLIPGIIIVSFSILKSKFIQNSSYEEALLSQLSLNELGNLFHFWSWGYFISAFKSWLFFPTIMFIFWMIQQLKIKKYFAALVLFFTTVLNAFFLLIIYKNGDSDMIMQKSFAPFVIGLSLPFMLSLTKTKLAHYFKFSTVLVSGIFAFVQIIQVSEFYTIRYNKLQKIVQYKSINNNEKVFQSNKTFNPEEWRVSWAIPYETLLISTLENRRPFTINLYYGDKPDSSILQQVGIFYGAEFAAPIQTITLNKRYFKFQDSGKYSLTNP